MTQYMVQTLLYVPCQFFHCRLKEHRFCPGNLVEATMAHHWSYIPSMYRTRVIYQHAKRIALIDYKVKILLQVISHIEACHLHCISCTVSTEWIFHAVIILYPHHIHYTIIGVRPPSLLS